MSLIRSTDHHIQFPAQYKGTSDKIKSRHRSNSRAAVEFEEQGDRDRSE